MASSVCGEVGFAAIEVLWREERVLLVLVGLEGACRRRNLMSRGVSVGRRPMGRDKRREEKGRTAGRDEAGDVVVVEAVNALQIPKIGISTRP
jgi:hypothetical protein